VVEVAVGSWVARVSGEQNRGRDQRALAEGVVTSTVLEALQGEEMSVRTHRVGRVRSARRGR